MQKELDAIPRLQLEVLANFLWDRGLPLDRNCGFHFCAHYFSLKVIPRTTLPVNPIRLRPPPSSAGRGCRFGLLMECSGRRESSAEVLIPSFPVLLSDESNHAQRRACAPGRVSRLQCPEYRGDSKPALPISKFLDTELFPTPAPSFLFGRRDRLSACRTLV